MQVTDRLFRSSRVRTWRRSYVTPRAIGCLVVLCSLIVNAAEVAAADDSGPVELDGRRELFVDDYLIDQLDGASLELQHPEPREVVLVHDKPWEGNTSAYHTVFHDGDRYRMYYRGGHYDEQTKKMAHGEVYCYAESEDGIHWTRPDLGLHEYDGSKQNNIVIVGKGAHNFAPFHDANPEAADDAQYKAVGGGRSGLLPFRSADAVDWSLIQDQPVITDGAFDSLNIAFWDAYRKKYVSFFRDFRDGVRDIKTCTSDDFIHWTDPTWLSYEGAPTQHLYTNAITPYPRAPHIYVGFPKRFMPTRNPENHPGGGVSDCGFMTSRDGQNFYRWNDALIRPGRHPDRWVNRNNLAAWGLVVTEPDVPGGQQELSIYVTEGYYRGRGVRLRRYTFRLDGFVSVHAPADGGEMITKPLQLAADIEHPELRLNAATSAFGSVRCELQDADGKPIPGFELEKCNEFFGDKLDAKITWAEGADWSQLAGKPFRIRMVLSDADVYAIEWGGNGEQVAGGK